MVTRCAAVVLAWIKIARGKGEKRAKMIVRSGMVARYSSVKISQAHDASRAGRGVWPRHVANCHRRHNHTPRKRLRRVADFGGQRVGHTHRAGERPLQVRGARQTTLHARNGAIFMPLRSVARFLQDYSGERGDGRRIPVSSSVRRGERAQSARKGESKSGYAGDGGAVGRGA